MSLLHSFYCWGSVGVILLSSLFFTAFGIGQLADSGLRVGADPALQHLQLCHLPD